MKFALWVGQHQKNIRHGNDIFAIGALPSIVLVYVTNKLQLHFVLINVVYGVYVWIHFLLLVGHLSFFPSNRRHLHVRLRRVLGLDGLCRALAARHHRNRLDWFVLLLYRAGPWPEP